MIDRVRPAPSLPSGFDDSAINASAELPCLAPTFEFPEQFVPVELALSLHDPVRRQERLDRLNIEGRSL